jgi:cytoskeletal protein CcmA (bactofilin family)
MFKRGDKATGPMETLIGATVRISGNLAFSGGLHLDGRIDGDVIAPQGSLTVSAQGVVTGSVDVPQLWLEGSVRGDIHATDRLVLGPRAQVDGNVHYGAIEMAPGARINGKLVRLSGTGSTAAAKST